MERIDKGPSFSGEEQQQPTNGLMQSAAPPVFQLKTDDDKENKLLDASAIQDARIFFSKHQKDYSPAIIKELQQRVGVPATGQISDPFLQGIAREQKKLGLRPDGQPGPHTLPALFPHGLAEGKSQNDLLKSHLGIDYSKMDKQGKAKKALELVNRELAAAKVPPVEMIQQKLDEEAGVFHQDNWKMMVDVDFAFKDADATEQVDNLISILLHEARHAEQYYNMAQRLAGEGKDVHAIKKALDLPWKVIAYALNDPIKPDTAKALIAKNWHEMEFGKGKNYRDKVMGAKKMNVKKYRALPAEHDAHRVEDNFDDKLMERRSEN